MSNKEEKIIKIEIGENLLRLLDNFHNNQSIQEALHIIFNSKGVEKYLDKSSSNDVSISEPSKVKFECENCKKYGNAGCDEYWNKNNS